jgi:hypothetical protein
MKTEYRAKREQLLFEQQKSLIPALLPRAEREKKSEIYLQYITRTQRELTNWYDATIIDSVPVEDWKREKRELKRTIRALLQDRHYLLVEDLHTERKSFIMKCTVENCKGFLSTRYKCGLCETQICSECHGIKDQQHECNPDNIATVLEIKKNTKPCPSCHIPIFKSDGCDQMWCIQCHTAFSWKSGQIEKGIIHNPHYFDYLKEHGTMQRNPLDIPCGGLPNYRQVYEYMLHQPYTYDEVTYLRKKYERFSHLREYTLQHELPVPTEQVNYQDLLLDYILNRITEKQFKSTIYVREQKRNRGLEERQIIEAYVTIGEEAFRKLVQLYISIEEFINEIEQCKMYSQTELHKLNIQYEHTGFIRHDIL